MRRQSIHSAPIWNKRAPTWRTRRRRCSPPTRRSRPSERAYRARTPISPRLKRSAMTRRVCFGARRVWPRQASSRIATWKRREPVTTPPKLATTRPTREPTSASSGLAQAKAQVKQARAQIQQIESALKMAEVNLSYTTISSPIDGVVVSRNVDKGQTVAASLQAPTLFTIANDLTQMQVIANIDQADIGVINQGNRVSFTVDAFPGHNFGGTINQIRLSPQNVQNVITYNVVIDVKNPDLKLKPGMTANLTLTIAERQDALKIPNAALRFWPQGVPQEKRRELLHAGDTQARSGAGTEASKDGAKVPAPNDAVAKDADRKSVV